MTTITTIEWAVLEGQRPRHAGSNARLGNHGLTMRDPIARITTTDGTAGFGFSRITREQAQSLLGQSTDDLISVEGGVNDTGLPLEFALWDWLGHKTSQPVYALAAQFNDMTATKSLAARCYDTTLYFDDLNLQSDEAAVQLLVDEVHAGYARGHRAFKIKVGRGAMHMPLQAGIRRDIAIIRGIRDFVGPDIPLMIDANNGYNYNITRDVLRATADCNLFWMEEAFHEDPVLYRHLHDWMQAEGLQVLIADGEGQAAPRLLEWAEQGLIDVVQYDLRDIGFTRWLKLGKQLDDWSVKSAPHNYGSNFGNYASCHLAGAIGNFAVVEWDHADTPGLIGKNYKLVEGKMRIPASSGWGLQLDDAVFATAVQQSGFTVT